MKQVFILIALCMYSICGYAQNNQYLEQMLDQVIKTYEQSAKQQNEIYERAIKNVKDNMTATALILPGEKEDSYRALAVINCSGFMNDLIFEYCPNKKSSAPCFAGTANWMETMIFEKISLNDCVVMGQYVWLPEVLKPNYTLRISKKGVTEYSNKELYITTIPSKESSDYIVFKKKTYENLSYLSTVFGGSSSSGSFYSSPNSSNGNSSGSSNYKSNKCSRCNGTGEIIESTASYIGGTKWCSKCNKEVVEGHFHTICPVCGGKGYR